MDPSDTRTRRYRFGPFELNAQTGELQKDGYRIRLGDQSCRVLSVLLQRPGELVTREELQQRLWSDGTSVDFDHGLNVIVGRLRQTLGDTPERPRYIETVPRKGYRFVSSVEPVEVPRLEMEPNRPDAMARSSRNVLSDHRLTLVVAALAGLAGIFLWLQYSRAQPYFLSATPLTSYVGAEHCPSFSPDGKRVAFSAAGDKQDNYDIYVKEVGIETPLRLTTDPRPELSPAWSPDGRTVAFLRLSGTATADVLLMPALASGPERLLAKVAAPNLIYRDLRFLTWSTDGRWLAISAAQSTIASAELSLLSTETGERRVLVSASRGYSDLEPAFSPDMTRIAFVRHSGAYTGDLFVIGLTPELRAKGEPERLTFDNQLIGSPVWTQDGRAVVFTRYSTPGKPSIWKLTLGRTPRLETLPISADNALGLAISPPGHRLVYTRETTNSNIWSIRLAKEGEPATGLLIGSSGKEWAPAYSPDGQRIAFESPRSGWSEIWIADRDGSHPRQLTNLRGSVASYPRWSPDGRKIIFHSRQKIYATLYVIDIATGTVRELKYDAVNDVAPSWSHDGKWIYFASFRTQDLQIWKVPAQGGRAIQLTAHGGMVPLEAQDGRFVLYTKQGYGIWRMPVTGGEEQQILSDPVAGDGSAYAPVSGGIYFIREATRDKEQVLMFLSYATGQYTTTAAIPRPVYLGLAISPDERGFLYTRMEHSSDLMLVENFR